jgi:hypothetical protein
MPEQKQAVAGVEQSVAAEQVPTCLCHDRGLAVASRFGEACFFEQLALGVTTTRRSSG